MRLFKFTVADGAARLDELREQFSGAHFGTCRDINEDVLQDLRVCWESVMP